MVRLIFPNDPRHPKIRELADTSQFSRRTVREATDYLPEDDAVLDAAIGEAVVRRDIRGGQDERPCANRLPAGEITIYRQSG